MSPHNDPRYGAQDELRHLNFDAADSLFQWAIRSGALEAEDVYRFVVGLRPAVPTQYVGRLVADLQEQQRIVREAHVAEKRRRPLPRRSS